jgi:hypothetical protein
MPWVECPTCNDCMPYRKGEPNCGTCGGRGQVKVIDEDEEARREEEWEAERDRMRMEVMR